MCDVHHGSMSAILKYYKIGYHVYADHTQLLSHLNVDSH